MAGNIERFEVVVIVFDFRPLGDAVADMGEELLDALQRAGHRMQPAGSLTTPWKSDVDTLSCQLGAQCGLLQLGLARIQHVLHTILRGVDHRPRLGTFLGRQFAQGLHQLGQLAFLAEVLNPDLLQGRGVFTSLHRLEGLRDQCIQVFHVQPPEVLAEPR